MIFLKKYWLVIVCALAVGAFTGLPSLLFLHRMGDNFQGVWPQFNGDAFFYLARSHEVFDGHPEMNHQYFFEHKDETYPQAIGCEKFLAFIAQIFNVSLPALQAAMDFIAPAVIFILTFILFYSVARQKYIAIIFPLFLYTVVMGGIGKPVHPQISFPILLVFLIFWLRLILFENKKILNTFLAGAAFGLLFLTYHYHWMFLIVLTGIYFLILLLKKDWRGMKFHIWMWIIALIVGIPYFIQFFKGAEIFYYNEMMVRIGMYFSHMPETFPRLIVALAWLAFFVFFARYYKIEGKPLTQVVASLLIANVIFPNHQIITGVIFQNANHWSWMPIFIYMLSGCYVWQAIKQKESESKTSIANKLILSALLVLLVVPAWRLSSFNLKPFLKNYSTNQSSRYIKYDAIGVEGLQYYRTIFDWINKNTLKDSVILADARLMNFIPVYTHANVYYTDYAQWLPASNEEIIERAILSNFFNKYYFENEKYGVDKSERPLWIQISQTESNVHIIFDKFGVNWELDYESKFSINKEHQKIKAVYEKLQNKGWNIALLKKYRLDYIIWDKNLFPDWNLDDYDELRKVYEKNRIKMYEFYE